MALTTRLLELRQKEIMPRLNGMGAGAGRVLCTGSTGLGVEWKLAQGCRLVLLANLSAARKSLPDMGTPLVPASCRRMLYQSSADARDELQAGALPAWSVVFMLADAPAARD